jgi:hypothetical protein
MATATSRVSAWELDPVESEVGLITNQAKVTRRFHDGAAARIEVDGHGSALSDIVSQIEALGLDVVRISIDFGADREHFDEDGHIHLVRRAW